jgi:hypothetical protein
MSNNREAQGFEEGGFAILTPEAITSIPVENPAMDEKQFWFDEQRLIKERVLMTPEIMVAKLLELENRVQALEEHNDDVSGQ